MDARPAPRWRSLALAESCKGMMRVTAPTTASSCLFSVMVEARERDGRVVFDFELTDILPSNSVKQIKEIIGDKIDIPPDQQSRP